MSESGAKTPLTLLRGLPAGVVEKLFCLGLELSQGLQVNVGLTQALDAAVRLLKADSGSISLINPNSETLEIEVTHGLPKEAKGYEAPVSRGITGWVAWNRRSARVDDVSKDSRYFAVRDGVKSELAVPLIQSDSILGVINLDSDQVCAFTNQDQQILELIASMLTPVIEHGWLYESARQKGRLLESLVRVSQVLTSSDSREGVLFTIVREAAVLMNARMCSLMLLDPSGDWLDIGAEFGAGEAYKTKPRLEVAQSEVGIVVRRRKPFQVENIQESGRYQYADVARREGLVSLLAVPLRFAERVLGTLNVYTDRAHVFSDEEIRALGAYGELSAVALERARLQDRSTTMEEELREVERLSALGLLAAEIAHEIRNPLTVMKMLHHPMLKQFSGNDTVSTDMRIMGEKMDHLNRIVDRVLDFARRSEPSWSHVDLRQRFDDLLLLVRHRLRSQGVEVQQRLGKGKLEVVGDAVQLEQAFLNLTLNAVEAMPQGGKLLIQARLCRKSAEESTRHVAIRFRDTGQGMSPEQTQRLFSSLLNTTKARGTGLGLAIVKRVIEQHSGRIRVWSRLGFGTAFLILLPVEQLTNSSQA